MFLKQTPSTIEKKWRHFFLIYKVQRSSSPVRIILPSPNHTKHRPLTTCTRQKEMAIIALIFFCFFSFIKERKEDERSKNKAPIDFCRQTRHMPNGSNPFRRHTRHMPIRIHHFKPHKPLLPFCNVLVWDREGCVRSCKGIAWAENIKWRECYLVALVEQLSRKNVS